MTPKSDKSKPKKPKALTLGNFRTWLKGQDPEGHYSYHNPPNCLLAQFGRAMGYDVWLAGVAQIVLNDKGSSVVPVPREIEDVAYYPPLASDEHERSYGGALRYLEATYGKRR